MSKIFTIEGIKPEQLAYGMARYSRSADSFQGTLDWMRDQERKAGNFLNTFYFQYGHKSIADMAHIPMALEDITILAAIELEKEQLWDGQERSTRYQDFSKSGYYLPPALEDEPGLRTAYVAQMEMLIWTYHELHRALTIAVTKHYTEGARRSGIKLSPAEIETMTRTIKARCFDVVRSLLPYGLYTSVGQITSARTLESQISRLMANKHQEIREIAASMKEAASLETPFNPTVPALVEHLEVTGHSPGRVNDVLDVLGIGKPLAPTLVKYTEPDTNEEALEACYTELVRPKFDSMKLFTPSEFGEEVGVDLYLNDLDPATETLASLTYRYSDYSWRECLDLVSDIPQEERWNLYANLRGSLNPKTPVPDIFHTGQRYLFDITLDGKGMQDFYRHRNNVQIRQPLNPYETHQVSTASWFAMGLPKEVDASPELAQAKQDFETTLYNAGANLGVLAPDLERVVPGAADYLIPVGTLRRSLFKMDLAQAQYIITTRSAPQGHFSYRKAAVLMRDELLKVHPELDGIIRYTKFEHWDFLTR